MLVCWAGILGSRVCRLLGVLAANHCSVSGGCEHRPGFPAQFIQAAAWTHTADHEQHDHEDYPPYDGADGDGIHLCVKAASVIVQLFVVVRTAVSVITGPTTKLVKAAFLGLSVDTAAGDVGITFIISSSEKHNPSKKQKHRQSIRHGWPSGEAGARVSAALLM